MRNAESPEAVQHLSILFQVELLQNWVQGVTQDASLQKRFTRIGGEQKTIGSVSDVVLEQGREIRTNVNISDGVLRLRVLLFAVPHALSNVEGLAVGRNVVANFQTEGLSGPKSAASKKSKQNSVTTCGLRNDLLDLFGCIRRFALLSFVDDWKPDVMKVPVTRMN